MSYSSKVKAEILRGIELDENEFTALLSAVMKVTGTLSILPKGRVGFRINTENPTTARFLYKNIKEKLNIKCLIKVRQSTSLKKTNMYMISFDTVSDLKSFLIKTSILEFSEGSLILNHSIPRAYLRNDNLKRAFLKGAFLGSGSISDPEKQYHLEFVCRSAAYADDFKKLLESYKMTPKIVTRQGSYVLYLKEGEQIIDLLNLIGAHNSLLQIENIRIIKGMRNNVNRLVNCETANLTKTVNAAMRQVEAIKRIKKEIGLSRLPKNLQDIAKLRLKYPDISLTELGEFLNPPIGKSGVNHRLRKIEKIANELDERGEMNG